MTKHLWEVGHSYYCSDTNYLADYRHNHGQTLFSSWSDFIDEFGDADQDYNMIFRWDWKVADPQDYDLDGEYGEPEELPGDKLHLYYMMQRKGFFQVMIVDVEKSDEDDVRRFLEGHAEYIKALWEPLL